MRAGRAGRLMLAALIVAIGGFGYLAGRAEFLAPQRASAADECQTFTQTGKQICGRFLEYWLANGGLAQQGLPLSDPFPETIVVDGAAKVFTVQYFERAIFEAHPENQRPYDVLLSLVGGEKYRAKYPNGPGGSPAPPGTPRPAPGVFPRSARSQAVAVTIHAIQDTVPGDQYFEPQAGYRWVAIDASVQNITTRNLSYNALYGKLQTVDNREWAQPLGGKNPAFSYGTQQPNETNRGWFTFEVPTGAELATFAYDPTFGSAPLRIPLR